MPTYQASGAEFSGDAASVAVAAPSGVVANSVVVVVFFLNGATNQNVVPPAGWTAAAETPVAAENHRLYVYWHRAAGAEAGPYTFTWDSSVFREGQAHRYEDVITSGTPLDTDTDFAVDNISGTTTPAVQITTDGPNRQLLHAATAWSGGTWTPPSGFTKRQQPTVGLSTLADKTQAGAGASGAVTATVTNADKRTAWLGALKPVPQVTGTASAPLGGLTAAATGVRTVGGTASAALGGLAAQIAAPAAAGGGWYKLLDIAAEAAYYRATEQGRPPAACPNDGEPLRQGPGGVLFCPFDGYQWPRDRGF